MTFLRLLARVELRALVAVLAVAVAVSLCVYASALFSPASMLPPSDWTKIAFLYALALGLPIAALVGAPAYAVLKFNRLDSWPAVFALGILPGVIILVVTVATEDIGFWFAGCGVAVACLTHLMSRQLSSSKRRERSEDAL